MKKNVKTWILVNVIFLSILLLFGLSVMVLRNLHMTGCTINTVLGLYCPGCGATRSLESLLHFNLVDAFKYNAIIPIGLVLFIYYDVKWLLYARLGMSFEFFKGKKFIPIIFYIIFIFIYFLVRNILLICGIDIMLL